jgi:hypothetical protein
MFADGITSAVPLEFNTCFAEKISEIMKKFQFQMSNFQHSPKWKMGRPFGWCSVSLFLWKR